MPLASNGSGFDSAYGELSPNGHHPDKKRGVHFSRAGIKAQIDHLRTGLKSHRSSKDLSSQHSSCSPDTLPVGDSDIICISPLFPEEDDDDLYNATFLGDVSLECNESIDQHVDAALASFSSDCEIGVPISGSVSTATLPESVDVWRPTSVTDEDSMLCSPLTAYSEDSSDASGAFNTSPALTDDCYEPYGTNSDANSQYPSQTPLNISIDEFGLSSSPRASFVAPHYSTGFARQLGLPIITHSGTVSKTVKSVSVYSASASHQGLPHIEAGKTDEHSKLKQEKRQRRDSPYFGGFSFADEISNENAPDSFLNTHKSRRSCWECPCIPKIAKRQTKWSSSLGLTPAILDHSLVEQRDKELDYELDHLCRSATPSVASTAHCELREPTPPLIVPAYRLSFEQLLDSKFNMDSVQVARQSSDLACDCSYSAVSANPSESESAPGRPTQHSGTAPRFFSLSGKRSRNLDADIFSLNQNEYEQYVLSLPSPGPLIPIQQGEGLPFSDFPDLVISQSCPTVGLEHTRDSFDHPDTLASTCVDEGPASRTGKIIKHSSESTNKLKHFASRLFKRRTVSTTHHHPPDTRQYSQMRRPLDDLLLDLEGGTDAGWLTFVQEDWEVLSPSSSSRFTFKE